MSAARVCDGPGCNHAAAAEQLPAGWLQVTISAGPGMEDEPLAGFYDFAAIECFDAWLDSLIPKPDQEPEKTKRKTTRRAPGHRLAKTVTDGNDPVDTRPLDSEIVNKKAEDFPARKRGK